MLRISFDTVGKMSARENIQFFHVFDVDTYLRILVEEYEAKTHPKQADAYLLEGLPFYAPRQIGEHVSVLSFNYAPLPSILINALADHPELVPDEIKILWTIEQELCLETTMRELRANTPKKRYDT